MESDTVKYPNAQKGISKIYLSELLNMLADIAIGIVLVILVMHYQSATQDIRMEGAAVLLLVCSVAATVLNFISLIMMVIGTVQTAKDQLSFRPVMILTLVNIAVATATAFFPVDTYLSNFGTVAGQLISLICSLLIILGISRMATQLQNTAVNAKCAGTLKIVLGIGAVALLVRLFNIFMVSTAAQGVNISLAVFSLVLNVLQYIFYLPLLSSAKKMLA